MKFHLLVLLVLVLFQTSAYSLPECQGTLSLETKESFSPPIKETYDVSGFYFLGLQGLKVSTTTSPQVTVEYDFCSLEMKENLFDYLCDPLEGSFSERFPKQIRIVENKEKSSPGAFSFSALGTDSSEVPMAGSVTCSGN